MKRHNYFSAIILTILFLSFSAYAETARDITGKTTIECYGIDEEKILDNDISTISGGTNVKVTIYPNEEIGGIYIKYNNFSSKGTLNEEIKLGENGFIHEFVPLSGTDKVTLSYPYVSICDIMIFSQGNMPKDIQLWQTGNSKTDILLCSTHSDDDQLFFAGLLPYYAGVKKANVRVAYFANHYDTHNRTHELLDGLWECGVTNYPDILPFPDGWSESVDEAINHLKNNGFSYDDIISEQKKLIEKYTPLVVVLHDFDGEYGHGAHMLNTKSFIEAIECGTSYVPEKIYVHLYKENEITLDIDTPLEEFGGLTAFQVSQKAFEHHKSQHWTWLYEWLYGKNKNKTHSSQIRSYHPSKFGLYHSRIGKDTNKNCILENVTLYSQRKTVLPEVETEHGTIPTTNLSIHHEQKEESFSILPYTLYFVLILIIATIIFKLIKRKKR